MTSDPFADVSEDVGAPSRFLRWATLARDNEHGFRVTAIRGKGSFVSQLPETQVELDVTVLDSPSLQEGQTFVASVTNKRLAAALKRLHTETGGRLVGATIVVVPLEGGDYRVTLAPDGETDGTAP